MLMLQTKVDVWMSGVDEAGPVSLVAQWEPSRNGQKYTAPPLSEAQLIHMYVCKHKYTNTYTHIHKYKCTIIHPSALLLSENQTWAVAKTRTDNF